jgi:Xaa-Pro aminopeptidase
MKRAIRVDSLDNVGVAVEELSCGDEVAVEEGFTAHEAPFLDIGDDTLIRPGMILSVEPGLYVQGTGRFRHSDTVLVTDSGIECLAYYPRDLESLIC